MSLTQEEQAKVLAAVAEREDVVATLQVSLEAAETDLSAIEAQWQAERDSAEQTYSEAIHAANAKWAAQIATAKAAVEAAKAAIADANKPIDASKLAEVKL